LPLVVYDQWCITARSVTHALAGDRCGRLSGVYD
jgi:hypothetical protein